MYKMALTARKQQLIEHKHFIEFPTMFDNLDWNKLMLINRKHESTTFKFIVMNDKEYIIQLYEQFIATNGLSFSRITIDTIQFWIGKYFIQFTLLDCNDSEDALNKLHLRSYYTDENIVTYSYTRNIPGEGCVIDDINNIYSLIV